MTRLAFDRLGAGPPLVLLHPLGSSRRAWDPVVPALAEHFDVLAVDLPGFGDSAALPEHVEPVPAALAAVVEELLDDLEIRSPHIVGNSLGGWIALELADVRPVATLTLLAPAGLWRDHTPMYTRAGLRASRWLAHHAADLLCRLVDYRVGRVLILGQTHGRPTTMSPDQARAAIRTLGFCSGFDATLAATTHRHYQAGSALDVPVTVAFGSRDLVLLRGRSRHLGQLPPHTQLRELPGCGHLPMSDDPGAVIAAITATVARTANATSAR
jgi:pimeloyl-ACP methyl ester carboxylesterase